MANDNDEGRIPSIGVGCSQILEYGKIESLVQQAKRRFEQNMYLLEPSILRRAFPVGIHIFFSADTHKVDSSIIKTVVEVVHSSTLTSRHIETGFVRGEIVVFLMVALVKLSVALFQTASAHGR